MALTDADRMQMVATALMRHSVIKTQLPPDGGSETGIVLAPYGGYIIGSIDISVNDIIMQEVVA